MGGSDELTMNETEAELGEQLVKTLIYCTFKGYLDINRNRKVYCRDTRYVTDTGNFKRYKNTVEDEKRY